MQGSIIYVYEKAQGEALATLKHEYIDCLLSRKLISLLITIVNALIKLKEEDIYREKERIITALADLI